MAGDCEQASRINGEESISKQRQDRKCLFQKNEITENGENLIVGVTLYYVYGQQRERASKYENSMNPSQRRRFSIGKAPDNDRDLFNA